MVPNDPVYRIKSPAWRNMAIGPLTNSLLTLSGSALARKIREGELSSFDAVHAHIDRAREVHPVLNAIVCNRFDEALQEAKSADDRLRAGDTPLPPFFGVPCSIKEAFALTGMPNTGGLVARAGIPATRDATAVSRLRAAGAIPIGVTNISELCMWMESDNRVYGRTNNPYDPKRTVGGSSGGEGALIGAGASPFGLGSDVGGSIRMPAFFNGIFGHKPTGALVPNTGQFPVATGAGLRYLTTGPMCRKAEDLMPLLRVLVGPDGLDTECRPFPLGDPASVDLSGLDVMIVETNGAVGVSRDLREAQRNAANALQNRGACIRTERIEALRHSFEIWGGMLADAGGESFASRMGNGQPFSATSELLRWASGRSDHTLPAIALAFAEKFPALAPERSRRFVRMGHALRRELVDRIGDGIMLYPSYARPAPLHYTPMLKPFEWVYTAIINTMELPATQVPLGLNSKGLPLGVQVVGRPGNDHVTIAVALELERAMGGWVPPASARN